MMYISMVCVIGQLSVADPGFPVGDVDLVGGMDSRGGYVSQIFYVKMKESGPLGGVSGCQWLWLFSN